MIKKGDRVIMNGRYYVPDKNVGKIWTVESDPWECCGTIVVRLDGKRGGYAVDGLDKVNGEK